MPEDIKWFIKCFNCISWQSTDNCVGKSILKAHNTGLWFFQGQKWWHKTFLRKKHFSPVKPFSHCSSADLEADCLYFLAVFCIFYTCAAHCTCEYWRAETPGRISPCSHGWSDPCGKSSYPSLSRARITGVSYLQVKTATHGRWYWLGL